MPPFRSTHIRLHFGLALAIFVSAMLPFHSIAATTVDSFKVSVGGKTDNVQATQNQPFTVSLEALDASQQTVTTYTGSVLFTSSDTKATVPTETTFTVVDQGKKDFNLGFKFITTGQQTITVVDSSDNSITGSLTVTVAGDSSGTNQEGKPVILAPTNQATINTAKVTISGTASGSADVTILDGAKVLGKVTADVIGNFTYTSDTLFDGAHSFTAQTTSSGVTLTSDPVQVTIDSTGAAIHNVTLTPSTTIPQGTVGIIVETENNLSLIEAIVDQGVTGLTEKTGTPGTYQGVLTAPQTAGSYPVSIRVTDQTQNKQTYDNQATLIVAADDQPPVVTITANPAGGISPLNVSFTSIASDPDGTVKTYSWDFGDGGISNNPNPAHIFALPGSYNVSLTVADDAGKTATARLASSILVTSPPTHTKDGPETWMALVLLIFSAWIGYTVHLRPWFERAE